MHTRGPAFGVMTLQPMFWQSSMIIPAGGVSQRGAHFGSGGLTQGGAGRSTHFGSSGHCLTGGGGVGLQGSSPQFPALSAVVNNPQVIPATVQSVLMLFFICLLSLFLIW